MQTRSFFRFALVAVIVAACGELRENQENNRNRKVPAQRQSGESTAQVNPDDNAQQTTLAPTQIPPEDADKLANNNPDVAKAVANATSPAANAINPAPANADEDADAVSREASEDDDAEPSPPAAAKASPAPAPAAPAPAPATAPVPCNSCGKDRLCAGQRLNRGGVLWSCNRQYLLQLQDDGNLVAYHMGPTRPAPIWSSQTTGNTAISFLNMQTDGNLVLYNVRNEPFWASRTTQFPGSFLVVQDDGNVVLYDASNVARWNSRADSGAILQCGVVAGVPAAGAWLLLIFAFVPLVAACASRTRSVHHHVGSM